MGKDSYMQGAVFLLPLLLPFIIPKTMLLQIGTASIVLLILTGKATGNAIVALGSASEELFRGDRLPILPFPEDIESK
jgi:hypothetical protein